jgi:hypothetical protein
MVPKRGLFMMGKVPSRRLSFTNNAFRFVQDVPILLGILPVIA